MNVAMTRRPQGTTPAPPRSERFDADDIVQLVRRNLALMLAVLAVILVATWLYLSRQENVYSAQAEMALTTSEVRLSQIDTQLETYDLNNSRVATQMDILRSRSFAEQVAVRLSLFDNPAFMPIPADKGQHATELHQREVVDKVLGAYLLNRSGESLVISVQAQATSPELAAQIANAVVTNFIDLSVRSQVSVIEKSTDYLRRQIDTLGEELSLKEIELASFIREFALDDSDLPNRLRRERAHMISVLQVMQADGQAASPETERIRAELARVEQQLAERTRNDLRLARMQRNVQLLSTRYQTAIDRLNELEPQAQLAQPDARQVSVAAVPVEPSWPIRGPTMALAGAAGLVLAFMLALMREGMNRRIWDGAQATRVSDLPNLGTLPRIGRKSLLSRDHDPGWFLQSFPRSAFAEALRSLYTIWSNQERDGRPLKVLMITSGHSAEGKSTVATSLAASASMEGLKVLLMDFDTQRGIATRILGVTLGEQTPEDLIVERIALDAAIAHAEGFEHLDVMAFTAGTRWTPRLLQDFSDRIMSRLRADYDVIVVDTPPALALADSIRLGAIADEAVVVTRWGKTTERVLATTVERLLSAGVPLAGTVINDVELRRFRQNNQGGGYAYY